MQRLTHFYTILTIFLLFVFVNSCSKNDPNGEGSTVNFDKNAMLVNYADKLIIPSFEQTQQKIRALKPAIDAFVQTPNTTTQTALKSVFKETFLQVEHISALHFGPPGANGFLNFINMLPANTDKKITDKQDRQIIDEDIAAGTWNLNSNFAMHRQGLPALDYLLFSTNAISEFTGANAANRKKYVNDVYDRIKLLLDKTVDEWKISYRTAFISNTKSNSGSPISYLLNQFAFELDAIKGPRIGWPYGTMSGGTQFPTWVEGYYAGISLDLAIENMKSLKRMFTGDGSGKGISDLLKALGKQDLANKITNQFDVVDSKLKAIPAPLSSALATNKKEIDEALAAIQVLLTAIKTDAVSALGVQISYIDNDGD